MKFGISTFCTRDSVTPADLAVAMEERGFESIWLPDHSHIPLSRDTSVPSGGDLPDEYFRVIEPFVGLATAATATESLKVGTGICLVSQHDAIYLAKAVATLDMLSGGRFLFGVGHGWNLEEMANHGVDPKMRGKVAAEKIAVLKTIWTEEAAEFHGEFHSFDPIACGPKPTQKPYPPIIVGGNIPYGARRAIEYGDEWFPFDAALGDVGEAVRTFRAMAEDAGRNPDDIPISLVVANPDPERLASYRDAGIHRVVLQLATLAEGEAIARLDQFAQLMTALKD